MDNLQNQLDEALDTIEDMKIEIEHLKDEINVLNDEVEKHDQDLEDSVKEGYANAIDDSINALEGLK